MNHVHTKRRPAALIVISILSLLTTSFFIWLYLRFPAQNAYPRSFSIAWAAIMIGLHLAVVTGIVFMFLLRRAGLWIFITAKIALLAIPFIAGTGDEVVGLLTPVLLLDMGIFVPLFANQVKHME